MIAGSAAGAAEGNLCTSHASAKSEQQAMTPCWPITTSIGEDAAPLLDELGAAVDHVKAHSIGVNQRDYLEGTSQKSARDYFFYFSGSTPSVVPALSAPLFRISAQAQTADPLPSWNDNRAVKRRAKLTPDWSAPPRVDRVRLRI
jgi:hypothetical protein